ncbi:Chemotaxis protein CheD, partial [hydrothermal vent metagenome]
TTGLERVFLLPAEYHITKKPKLLATLLGSCVAICVYNKISKIAAMNHFVHAESNGEKTNIGRFGDLSCRHIIDSLLSVDGQRSNYEAKIFGGGAVVGHLGLGVGIGEKNIASGRQVLEEYGIPIIESDVGGSRGRKIYFDCNTQKVEVRMIGEEKKDFTKQDIKVLVVDDSSVVRNVLKKVIESTEGMEVIGEAADAYEARDKMISLDPDVISLDIIMPKLDGLKFLEKIMQHYPKPVIICSTIAKDKSAVAKKAEKIGAVGVVDKDSLKIYQGLAIAKQRYVPMIRTAAQRKVSKKTPIQKN